MSGIIQSLLGYVRATVTDVYFNLVCFLLNTSSTTTTTQNNTFVDSSNNGYTPSRNPASGPLAPTQGTFSPFSQTGWSIYFGGTGNFLAPAAGNANYNPGATGAWTFETWVYITAAVNGSFYGVGGGGSNSNSMNCSYNGGTSRFSFTQSNGSNSTLPTNITSSTTSPINNWYHYAVTKDSSNVIRLFINGAQVGTQTVSSTISSGNRPVINGLNDNNGLGNSGCTGYISNLRWVKGQALANGNFTPPTSPLTSTTVGWTGANAATTLTGSVFLLFAQSNRFIDNSATNATFSPTGTPSIQAFSPLAPSIPYTTSVGGSGYFDGTGDYLTVANATPLQFGTSSFTINCWIYRNAAGVAHTIASKGSNTGPTGWAFQVTTANVLQFTFNIPATTTITSSQTIPANTWTYVTVVRDFGGGFFAIYINGAFAANTFAGSSVDFSQANDLYIGTNRSTANNFNGYISGFEYIKGTATIPSGVPTAPPTPTTNTQLLLNFTNAAIYDASNKTNIETVGTAQASITQTKFGTTSVFINGAGNYLLMPVTQATRFGSANWTIELFFRASTINSRQMILCWNSSTNVYAACSINFLANNKIGLQMSETGTDLYIDDTTDGLGSALSADTWYYLVVTRSGATITVYIDGSSIGTYTLSSATASLMTTATAVRNVIGAGPNLTGLTFNGYIDELRVTNGVARTITSTPTAAFPVQ